MVNVVLEVALVVLKARADVGERRVVVGARERRLQARLQPGLGLGHKLGAGIVPRRVLGRRNRRAQLGQVLDLDLAAMARGNA